MVVQHNITAMNSNRMLGLTQKSLSSSTEKLSSGYAINRAADNAAGLAISEKMRKQIRGLTQASTNAEDGISAVQTAEGALTEVHDMLQRMNELAVQAANGTNSEDDRSYIQDEIDQLTQEIDRVAETTKFNEIYLLKGDTTNEAGMGYSYAYQKYDTLVKSASVVFPSETSTGLYVQCVAFSDVTNSAMASSQTEFASLLKSQGLTLGTTEDDEGNVVYTLTLNGSDETSNFNAVAKDAANGVFQITDSEDNVVATITLAYSGGVGAVNSVATGTAWNDDSADKYYIQEDGTFGATEADDSTVYYAVTDGTDTYYTSDAETFYDADGNKVSGVSLTEITEDETNTIVVGSLADNSGDVTGTNLYGTDETKTLTSGETATKYISDDGTEYWVVDDGESTLIYDADSNLLASNLTASVVDTAGSDGYILTVGNELEAGQTQTTTATSAASATYSGDVISLYDKDGNAISANALSNYFTAVGGKVYANADTKVYDALGNQVSATDYAEYITATKDQTATLQLSLQVGADGTSNNKITVNIDAMSAKSLGINGLRVDGDDDTNATNAIQTIAAAVKKVSEQRAALGAVQNRLEHTINNLDNIVENTTDAEASIRDTDMATEMVAYANANILAQAGQSMLAQANQSNQGVLSLLG